MWHIDCVKNLKEKTPSLLIVLCLGIAAAGCSEGGNASRPASYPGANAPPPANAYPDASAAIGLATALAGFFEQLPCPPPGLPPEMLKGLDCTAMRRISGSAAYIPRQVAVASLPAAVFLHERRLGGPIKNQAYVGACSGFAMSSVLDNIMRRARRRDVVAPLHVFATYAGKGLDEIKGRPMTAEPVWPYDPVRACMFESNPADNCGKEYGVTPGTAPQDPRLQQERSRADSMGMVRIDVFEEMKAPIDPQQVALLIAGGEALFLSFKFYRPAWQSQELKRSGYLPYYSPESADQGHAVTIVGYRPGRWGRDFLIQNSWGNDWAHGGFAWVPEPMLISHANYVSRLRAVLSSVPAVSPPTSPPPTPNLPSIPPVCIPGLPCYSPSAGSPPALPSGYPPLNLPNGLGAILGTG
jgi:hypothetical protein